MSELLAPYPVVITVPVAWGDMDAFQHVNNTVYLRYFESGRIAYFEKIDYMGLLGTSGLGPILASTQCRFRIPLTYPDTVDIGTRVADIGEDRFLMQYVVVSRNHGKIAAEGDGLIVSFNYRENKKAPLPEEVRQRIAKLEGTTIR
jgi:acyl-CoA thioester hydrolase